MMCKDCKEDYATGMGMCDKCKSSRMFGKGKPDKVLTPEVNEINIKFPIWKTRSIGIAEERITDDMRINILYRMKDGSRLYPKTYTVSRNYAMSCPFQVVKERKLRIIPIKNLQEVV